MEQLRTLRLTRRLMHIHGRSAAITRIRPVIETKNGIEHNDVQIPDCRNDSFHDDDSGGARPN
jgi:hypothetical protein